MAVWISILALILAGATTASATAQSPEVVYGRDVRPILSDQCFRCHSFDEASRQADLRLDVADSAYKDRDGHAAIVPGDVKASELWRRITSSDETELMPPPETHRTLSDEQKLILRRWIEGGAQYTGHWSFIPPMRAALPTVRDESWPKNEIDRFVLARLDAEELRPAAEADRHVLMRRLSLDLTGLPPIATEVEAFISDAQPDAYEKLVDRLLASPHFGERMALDWLDAARYADTNGYSIDGGRHIWLWRDWVIDAFNRNMRYDQFLIEQLAGDLLPNATDAQRIATGFQRNNMVTHEGGTIPEENLVNYNADRVKTLGEAVLGLTLGCAQCHDHKYDPITQRDYYRMFAYFNSISDQGLDGNGGINALPSFETKTVLPGTEVTSLRTKIASLREELTNPLATDVAAWEEDQRRQLVLRGKDLQLHSIEVLKISTPNVGSGFDIDEGRLVRISSPQGLVAYDLSLRLPKLDRPVTGLRIVFQPAAELPSGGWGYGTLYDNAISKALTKGTFVLTSFSASAESVPGDQVNLNRLSVMKRVTANSWDPNFRPERVLDTRNENGWSPDLAHDGPAHITMTFAKPVDSKQTPFVAAQVNFGHGRQLVAGRFELFAITGHDDGSPLPQFIIATLEKEREQRSPQEQDELRSYYSAYAPAAAALRASLENHEERLRALTEEFSTLVMAEAEKPRDTHILTRGDYAQPGEIVSSGTPAALPSAPANTPINRLGLAQWIVMRENPLVARVAVNRIWGMFFGAGIVRTPADFGAQGEWPTHPELLDWLAVDFMENNWDVKALVRKIVMSATYRQSSVAEPPLLERDPSNRLLGRGPRFRLSAELVRDSALKTSGLLVDWVGGPSVNPYTPGDLWREVSHYGSTPATAQTFVQDHAEKLYRRSLYTYWKRTVPPPNMAAFDAPNRETCVVERPSTTTPLQALVLLNDTQFVEAARAFAERIIKKSDNDGDRLEWAFAECLSRPPVAQEFEVLTRALRRERTRYAGNPRAASDYLAVGESPRSQAIPSAEHAAWAQVATLLLNLSETVTRN